MNLESLRSLQKRIREATGPDREIDLEICKVFGIFKSVMKRLDAQGSLTADNLGAAPFTLDPDGIGPCVALLEAVFPGALWSVWNMEHGPGARILCPGKSGAFHDGQYAEVDELSDWTPASVCHALIDCAVSALIAQEEAKEKADA